MLVKVILKLNMIHLLSESKNFRNDGWCQQGYREKYKKAWHNNTGMNKGKSCHLSRSNTPMNGMKFRRVGENFGNSNHKGKL